MARKHFKPEQIISKLREAEILLSQGKTQEQAIRAIGVTGNTFYRWRKEYGGMELKKNWQTKADLKSPRYTTRISEVPIVYAR